MVKCRVLCLSPGSRKVSGRSRRHQTEVFALTVSIYCSPVATVLLLRGCLKPSDYIIAGVSHAKVRILSDSTGKTVRAAYPGMAVTVSGWKELPSAGDEVLQGTETEVKKALANRIRKAELDATLSDMEAINEQRRLEREQKEKEVKMDSEGAEITVYDGQTEGPKQLRLVIKADVSGSVEAVAGALQGIGNNVACVKIVATGVGDVTESDIMRAKAVGGQRCVYSPKWQTSESPIVFIRNRRCLCCQRTSPCPS